MEDIKQLAYNILSGEFVDSEGLLDNILMSKINDRLEDMKTDVMESQAIDEEGEIDEGIDVKFDRHINVHGKKPNQSAHAMWMFTHKRSGDVDYNKESEVHQTSGKFGEAKKSAKAWAKKHGHSEVYVMEQTDFEIDEEALDELSKKTLSSYVNKAASHATNKGVELGSKQAAADEIDRFTNRHMDDKFANSETMKKMVNADNGSINKVRHKAVTRLKGISTAVKKLTKENAELMGLELSEEELDELSKKTLGSYINKASHSLGINAMNMGAGPNKALHPADRDADYKKSRNTVTKRLKGLQNTAKQVTKENAELMGLELSEEELDELSKKTLASYATKASSSSHKNSTSNLSSRAAYKLATTNGEDDGEKEDRKSFMRSKGIATAIKKLTKENAELMGLELSEEELDELSKKTLGSYISKASRSLRKAEHSDMETFQKRDKGIKNAVDKYTRKKGDKRSVSKTH